MLRTVSNVNISLYRRSKGARMGTIKKMPILLLTAPGRTSGKPITTPVVYFEQDGNYVVCGSAGGQEAEPQWFRNLRATTTATIEVKAAKHDVAVRIAEGSERGELWTKLTGLAPFFAGYQKKTSRVLPIAVLTPTP
jgi:deazaflavin-dependent oxidoreductase (nitroreductase family)